MGLLKARSAPPAFPTAPGLPAGAPEAALLEAAIPEAALPETAIPEVALDALLVELEASEDGRRRAAARSLGAYPAAVAELAARLWVEPERPVQQALAGALARIATPAAMAGLVGLLRSEHARLRSLALEALQTIGPAALDALRDSLADADADVRIGAVVTLAGLPGLPTEALLIARAEQEDEVNVLAAIVEALDQVGGPACLPTLEWLAQRHAGDQFLAFAVAAVRARLAGEAS